jgi:hypothetical protein
MKMQKFASREATFPPGGCPSDEDLAAYIDNTLTKGEKARIYEHLASCERCYAIYMETLSFQLESRSAEPDGVVDAEVVDFRRPDERRSTEAQQKNVRTGGSWRRPARWLPLAALLLIGVGSGGYFSFAQFLASPQLKTTPAVPPPSGNQTLWLGPTYRGPGGDEEAKLDEASFRMGVQLVNLQTSLLAGKIESAQDVIARILGLLKTQPFTDDLQKNYTNLTVGLENAKPPALSRLSPDARQASQLLVVENAQREAGKLAQSLHEALDTPSLDLGQWVEAGRLSAMAHNPFFFLQTQSRTFLRRLLWNDKFGLHGVKLDPATRQSLDRVSEVLSRGDLRPSDYAELQQELEKILEAHYPQS